MCGQRRVKGRRLRINSRFDSFLGRVVGHTYCTSKQELGQYLLDAPLARLFNKRGNGQKQKTGTRGNKFLLPLLS